MNTTEWFRRAVPAPTRKNFHVQTGVHVEEFKEMLETMVVDAGSEKLLAETIIMVGLLATGLKKGTVSVEKVDFVEFFDAIVDQRVTGCGLAYMIGADLEGGVTEVDSSNESKFVDGQPIWDENGKIGKGPNYRRAELAPFMPAYVSILDK